MPRYSLVQFIKTKPLYSSI